MSKKVVWTTKAKDSLKTHCQYIAEDSPSAAKKVKREIVLTTKALSYTPNLFQLDEYYPNNAGDIRRFFRWNYRVVYQVRENEVVILNVYHTSVHPNQFQ